MANLDDRTRVIFTWGGIIFAIGIVFYCGTAWNDFRNTVKKNDEQDARLTRLEDRFVAFERQLSELQSDQKSAAKDAHEAANNSKAMLWAIGNLRTTLAEHGIKFSVNPQEND